MGLEPWGLAAEWIMAVCSVVAVIAAISAYKETMKQRKASLKPYIVPRRRYFAAKIKQPTRLNDIIVFEYSDPSGESTPASSSKTNQSEPCDLTIEFWNVGVHTAIDIKINIDLGIPGLLKSYSKTWDRAPEIAYIDERLQLQFGTAGSERNRRISVVQNMIQTPSMVALPPIANDRSPIRITIPTMYLDLVAWHAFNIRQAHLDPDRGWSPIVTTTLVCNIHYHDIEGNPYVGNYFLDFKIDWTNTSERLLDELGVSEEFFFAGVLQTRKSLPSEE